MEYFVRDKPVWLLLNIKSPLEYYYQICPTKFNCLLSEAAYRAYYRNHPDENPGIFYRYYLDSIDQVEHQIKMALLSELEAKSSEEVLQIVKNYIIFAKIK